MSLRAPVCYLIPEQTMLVAQAAFLQIHLGVNRGIAQLGETVFQALHVEVGIRQQFRVLAHVHDQVAAHIGGEQDDGIAKVDLSAFAAGVIPKIPLIEIAL